MKKEVKAKTSDYKESNMIVQGNAFIQRTNGSLNAIPLKLLKLIISCINSSNPQKDYSVYVRKQDLLSFIGVESTGEYSYLKEQLNRLITPVDMKDYNGEVESVALLLKFSWTNNNDLVKFTFDKAVWKQLVDLKKNFLKYPIANIKGLKKKPSMILYENLLSYTRQSLCKTIQIDMETLRFITGTEKKYKKYADFKKNILIPAQEEINGNPNLEYLFDFEKVEKGGKVVAVIFKLKYRTSKYDTLTHTEYPEDLWKDI